MVSPDIGRARLFAIGIHKYLDVSSFDSTKKPTDGEKLNQEFDFFRIVNPEDNSGST